MAEATAEWWSGRRRRSRIPALVIWALGDWAAGANGRGVFGAEDRTRRRAEIVGALSWHVPAAPRQHVRLGAQRCLRWAQWVQYLLTLPLCTQW